MMMKLKVLFVILVISVTINAEETKKKETNKKRDAAVEAKEKTAYDYTAPSQSGYDASGYGDTSAAGYDSFTIPQVALPSGSYGTPIAPPLNEHTYNGGSHGIPEYAALHAGGGTDTFGNDLNSYGAAQGSVGAVSVAALTSGLTSSYPGIQFHDDSSSSNPSSGTYQTIGYEIADPTMGNGGPPVIAIGGHASFGGGAGGSHNSPNSITSNFATSSLPSQYGAPAAKPWTVKQWQAQSQSPQYSAPTSKPWASQSNAGSYGTMSQGWIKLNNAGSTPVASKGWASQGNRGGNKAASNTYSTISNAYSGPSYSSSTYSAPSTSSTHQTSGSYGIPSSSFSALKQRPDYSVPSYAQGHKGLKHYSSPANSIQTSFGFSGHSPAQSAHSLQGGYGGLHGGNGLHLGQNNIAQSHLGHHQGSHVPQSHVQQSHGAGFGGGSTGPYSNNGYTFSGYQTYTPSFGAAGTYSNNGIHGSPGFSSALHNAGIAQSYNSGPQKFNGGNSNNIINSNSKHIKQIPLTFSSKPLQGFTAYAAGSKAPFKPSAFLGAIGGEDGGATGYDYTQKTSFSPQRSYLPAQAASQNYGVPSSNYLPSQSYGPSSYTGPSSPGGYETHGYEH